MMFGQLETDTYVWIAILVEYAWSLLYTQHTCFADRDANGMNEQKQLRRATTGKDLLSEASYCYP